MKEIWGECEKLERKKKTGGNKRNPGRMRENWEK
jgi:hypothetical protein